MADHHNPLPPRQHESAMDYAQHEHTYDQFIRITKIAITVIAVLVVLLYVLIRP